jgi:enamine deaminase RidA (YjgF/YER057c/UK114 family)
MAGRIEARLRQLDLVIPPSPAPLGAYVPFVVTGTLVFIAGQLPVGPGGLEYVGKLGQQFNVEEGKLAARLCAINLISRLRDACEGDLDRVKKGVKVCGFINSSSGFTEFAPVMDGCSNLLVEVFGEIAKHARVAVGAPSLPRGAAVEVDGIFEIA